ADEQRISARRILLDLVTLDETRARRSEKELIRATAVDRAALDALVAGRLVVARQDADETVYEVAHEALIRGWGSLRRWWAESVEVRALKQRLEAATAEWQRLGSTPELLWSAAQLAELRLLAGSELAAPESDFLLASRRAVRQRRRSRQAQIAAAPILLLC